MRGLAVVALYGLLGTGCAQLGVAKDIALGKARDAAEEYCAMPQEIREHRRAILNWHIQPYGVAFTCPSDT